MDLNPNSTTLKYLSQTIKHIFTFIMCIIKNFIYKVIGMIMYMDSNKQLPKLH